MIGQMIDRVVGTFSPAAGVRRVAARQALEQLRRRGLDAGKPTRWNGTRRATSEAGDLRNLAELQNVRADAWNLWHNNVHARKVVRTLAGQIVGCGLIPESLATAGPAGKRTAFTAFQDAAKQLWAEWGARCDWLGPPGRGGLDLAGMQRQIVREWSVSGESLIRFRVLTAADQQRRGLTIPLALEVLESERLAETDSIVRPRQKSGNARLFRGIEYEQDGPLRKAYHFYKAHPQDPKWWNLGASFETVAVPADEILHVYSADRPSQTRGVSWFAPALLQIRDVGDYQHNELMASAVASCVSLLVKTENGAGRIGGLNATPGAPVTDMDGNPVTRMQPGLIAQVATTEDVQGFNPQRPSTSADAFVVMMLRSLALSFPGVKPSTVHGDYRASSWASERSADNDCWRETEEVQEELAAAFCRPIWSAMVEAGVMSGWFDAHVDLCGFGIDRYRERRADFDATAWAGPVAKSINPLQDENAIAQGLRNGTISVPDACAMMGYNWREILAKQADVMRFAEQLGLPDGAVAGLFGLSVGPSVSGIGPDPNAADPSANPDSSGDPNAEPAAGPKGVAA